MDRPADRKAVLCTCIAGLLVWIAVYDRCKCVAGLDRLVANKSENVAVKIVRAAFRYDVDDTARSTPEFGHIRVCGDLILLNGLLRNRRAGGIDRVVRKVGAVDLNERRAATLSADVQSRSRCRADRTAVVTADS